MKVSARSFEGSCRRRDRPRRDAAPGRRATAARRRGRRARRPWRARCDEVAARCRHRAGATVVPGVRPSVTSQVHACGLSTRTRRTTPPRGGRESRVVSRRRRELRRSAPPRVDGPAATYSQWGPLLHLVAGDKRRPALRRPGPAAASWSAARSTSTRRGPDSNAPGVSGSRGARAGAPRRSGARQLGGRSSAPGQNSHASCQVGLQATPGQSAGPSPRALCLWRHSGSRGLTGRPHPAPRPGRRARKAPVALETEPPAPPTLARSPPANEAAAPAERAASAPSEHPDHEPLRHARANILVLKAGEAGAAPMAMPRGEAHGIHGGDPSGTRPH